MKKLLLTGASGFFGSYLLRELSKKYVVTAISSTHPEFCLPHPAQKIDIRNFSAMSALYSAVKPDITVHAAAVANPSRANLEARKGVFDTNVSATKNIAELCEMHNSKLIYLSTDLVYAGYRGSCLREDAKLVPLSLYAETKLMGEQKVQQTFDNFIILRTALLFGFGKNNSYCFFDSMVKEWKAGKPVRLFTDQFRSPLAVFDAARLLTELCGIDIKSVILNFGGPERVSRFDLAKQYAEKANYNPLLLTPITLDDAPTVPKVEDTSMDCSLLNSLGLHQTPLYECLLQLAVSS